MNIKLISILLLLGSTFASSALSSVAFTSYETMLDSPVEIIKNEMVRNTTNSPELSDCSYLRDYVAKYNFESSKKHPHIWYFIYQCLDDDMGVNSEYVTFNYTGDETDAETKELPEGCVPPAISERPTNPCNNGIAIGKNISMDVSKLVTKKLIHHPLSDIKPIDSLDTTALDTILRKLPELEELLEETIKTNHATEIVNVVPEKTEDPSGEITETYTMPSGTVVVVVTKPDETVEKKTTLPNGKVITAKISPDKKTIVETTVSPKGTLKKTRHIIENPDNKYEEIVTVIKNGVTISEITRTKQEHTDVVSDITVPDNVEDLFTEASEEFADVLKDYVEDKVHCFAENIINVKENYLTFVCSTTGHKNIKDLLESEFGDSSMCKNGYCDEIQNELMDHMLDNHNNGIPENTGEITSKILSKDLTRIEK